MRTLGLGLAAAAAIALAGAARADIVEATPNGFQVKQVASIAAPADKVWLALADFGGWWDQQHSWSGDSHNFKLDLTPGGCLCEALPHGGGVRHMTVVFVAPGKSVVLDGALGPLLFSGTAGRLIWNLEEKDGKTTVTQTYFVGGYFPGGLDKVAPAVDGVMTHQIGRLKTLVETGKPA